MDYEVSNNTSANSAISEIGTVISQLQQCVVCHRLFELVKKEDEVQQQDTSKKVFTACSVYLKPEVFTKASNWDNLSAAEQMSPFCSGCFSSGEKLSVLHELLDEIKKKIDILADHFSTDIIQARNECVINGSEMPNNENQLLWCQVIDSSNIVDVNGCPILFLVSPSETLATDEVQNVSIEMLNEDFFEAEIATSDSNTSISATTVVDEPLPVPVKQTVSVAATATNKIKTKQKDKRIKCNVCSLVCKTKVDLIRHRALEHSTDGRMFTCNLCLQGLKTKIGFEKHLKSHSVESMTQPQISHTNVSDSDGETGAIVSKKQRLNGLNCFECGHPVWDMNTNCNTLKVDQQNMESTEQCEKCRKKYSKDSKILYTVVNVS